jgi:hypothetical protein
MVSSKTRVKFGGLVHGFLVQIRKISKSYSFVIKCTLWFGFTFRTIGRFKALGLGLL